jgi:hypothetical protein
MPEEPLPDYQRNTRLGDEIYEACRARLAMMPCWSWDLTSIRPIRQLYPVNFVYTVDEWQMSVGQVTTYYAYLAVMSVVASFGVMPCRARRKAGRAGAYEPQCAMNPTTPFGLPCMRP